MTNTRSQIVSQQVGWAANRRIAVTSGYTESLDGNLFQPLHSDTLAEFQRGSGDELGRNGHRGKMQALHSSSALAVNVFDYWRGQSLAWVARALSLTSEPSLLRFEAQFATGLPGNPPNLDLAFVLTDRRTVAVESKFTEPYAHAKQVPPFKLKYFPAGDGLWHNRALPQCQRLADRLQRGELEFLYLNAAQLLKHILGLAQLSVGQFTLFYLWYAARSDEGRHHGEDLRQGDRFRSRFSCPHLSRAVFLSTTRSRDRARGVRELPRGAVLPGMTVLMHDLSFSAGEFEIWSAWGL